MNIEINNINKNKDQQATLNQNQNQNLSMQDFDNNFSMELKEIKREKEIVLQDVSMDGSADSNEVEEGTRNLISYENKHIFNKQDVEFDKNIELRTENMKPIVELQNLEIFNTENITQKDDKNLENKDNLLNKSNIKPNAINLALDDLNYVVQEFNQSDENKIDIMKEDDNLVDKEIMINKDYSIKEDKEILPSMNSNMNFSSDGRQFASFMNNENEDNKNLNMTLSINEQEIKEEAEILSTMDENIEIVNRIQESKIHEKVEVNQIMKPERFNTSQHIENFANLNKHQILKSMEEKFGEKDVVSVDKKQNTVMQENVFKIDAIVMKEVDVEIFQELIKNGEVDFNKFGSKSIEKSAQVSKTLVDLLIKARENNKPIRIEFDNNISVIIKISREGKITADFLPSSQVAEAYLKENLPILRQRFDDNNIEYDSLNQRERKDNKENNRKKERNNE